MNENRATGLAIALGIAIVLWLLATYAARSASFYPACLNPDGDWLHGVTARECRQLGGHWYTASVLKKARKVW